MPVSLLFLDIFLRRAYDTIIEPVYAIAAATPFANQKERVS